MIGFTPVISKSIKCTQLLSHTHKQTGAGSKPSTNSLKVFVDSPVCVTYPEKDEESCRLFNSPCPCTVHNYKTTKHLWSCFRIVSLQGIGSVDLTVFHCHHTYIHVGGHFQNKYIKDASSLFQTHKLQDCSNPICDYSSLREPNVSHSNREKDFLRTILGAIKKQIPIYTKYLLCTLEFFQSQLNTLIVH